MLSAPLKREGLKRIRHDFCFEPNRRSGCCVLIQRMNRYGGPPRTVAPLVQNRAVHVDEVIMDFASAKRRRGISGVRTRNQLVVHLIPVKIAPGWRRRMRKVRRAED